MKITIELTDKHLSAIKEQLRVTCAMRVRFIKNLIPETDAEGYALRILKVRRLLDLSMASDEACWDFKMDVK